MSSQLAEDPANTPQRKAERATALRRHDGVVCAKTALAGPGRRRCWTACRATQRLAQARRLLGMPAANPQAREDAQAFMRRVAAIDIGCCPHCKTGRWAVIACVLPQRRPKPSPRWALALRHPIPQTGRCQHRQANGARH